MAEKDAFEQRKVDPRIYLAIVFFRWKIIVVCFLYCLLGGVVYLLLAPKQYYTSTRVMIYHDPTLQVTEKTEFWRSWQLYQNILQSERMVDLVVPRLEAKWASEMGGVEAMRLPVSIRVYGNLSMMDVSVISRNPPYNEAFLKVVLEEFNRERKLAETESYQSAIRSLEDELDRLETRIKDAESDVIEFQRVNQLTYVTEKGNMERSYLGALMNRRRELTTELMMLDSQFGRLGDATPGTIADVVRMTEETARVVPLEPGAGGETGEGEGAATSPATPAGEKAAPTEAQLAEEAARRANIQVWQEGQVELNRLKEREKLMLQTLRPEHPEIVMLRKQIADLEAKLAVTAEVERERVRSRKEAIRLQVEALEAAERRWQNSYFLASQKQADFRHLQAVVGRYEGMYHEIYGRLQELRVDQEMRAERFQVVRDVGTNPKPAWPDPFKILLMALAAGLGTGFGFAFLTHFLDNKVQSIVDVEEAVGVPFLGGVPFWVHSNLDRRIRPIVGEEHSSGASEAYRSLRTNILLALDKANKKVALFTSADSKEGKTLTVLNLSLMVARSGKKVLLLDMDLRRGVLHKSLEMERSPGITDVLKAGGSLRKVIGATAHENLWFAPSGSTVKNTAELLQATDLHALINDVKDDYDYVFMDSAPVLRVTDTVILADPKLCAVIYIAHANRTPKPMIRYSIEMLGEAHILGLVVNSLEMHKISSLFYSYQYPNYAYYSYAYAYGYDYDMYGEGTGVRGQGARRKRSFRSRYRSLVDWFRRTLLPMD